jgi:hypothetical protein
VQSERREEKMNKAKAKKLAEKIAIDLLTVHLGMKGAIECTRMQLMYGKDDNERNMGGRCKQSMIDCIAERLEKGEI